MRTELKVLGYGSVLLFSIAGLIGALDGATLKVNGTEYVSLRTVAERLGMKRQWVVMGKQMILRSDWTRMEFRVNDRDIRINGIRVYLGSPVAFRQGDLNISKLDLEYTVSPVLTPQIYSKVPKLYRIVLDAGHGGKDPGTQNKKQGLEEKTLVLDISQRLGLLLQNMGYEVEYTRKSDRFIRLDERPRLANRLKADLFLSVHLNGTASGSVNGSETYAFTPRNQPSTKNSKLSASDRRFYPGNRNNEWSTLVGYYVQRELTNSLKTPDRGLKRGRWDVLRTLECPGLLIEAAFVTNSKEARMLKTQAYRQRIAQAIATGVFRYQRTINRLRGKSVGAESKD